MKPAAAPPKAVLTDPSALMTFFGDLHVHIGRSPWGGPVKISASPGLTVGAALEHSAAAKGLHLLGVVDAQTRGGLAEIETLVDTGALAQLPGGGLAWNGAPGPLTLIPGAEVETMEDVPGGPGGQAHWLVLVPGLEELRELHRWYAGQVLNDTLSSQRVRWPAARIQELAAGLGGLFIPAHVFTPFKSLYGRCAASWRQVLDTPPDAVELGLSADADMADHLPELAEIPFLSHSDAHSVARIAREHTAFRLARPTFDELGAALAGREGRGVEGNFGLDPRLGKYFRSHCRACRLTVADDPPVTACPRCGARRGGFVPGVLDRIVLIGGRESRVPQGRPPYVHQIPLEFIPGLGKAKLRRLHEAFGSEMVVLHEAAEEALAAVVGPEPARLIVRARSGGLTLAHGGGGRYGKVASRPREGG